MTKIKVKTHPRYIKRKISRAVGKNILKTLTEPITNSDDSYRRIEDKAIRTSGLITVIIDRKSRKIQVIDRAEGMDKKDLEDKFGTYGADKSGWSKGVPVRGLFGQGIEDVLYYHKEGVIKSIKDNYAYLCKFYWEANDRYIETKEIGIADEKLRKNWQIPEGNGTLVEFILDKDTPIYSNENLLNRLKSFYMLRLINSNPQRRVKLIDIARDGRKIVKQLRYEFPKGKVLDKKEFLMKFENYKPIKIVAEIKLSRLPLSRAGEESESGLLVFDEKNTVYDLTFFGLDNYPGTEKLFGFVKLIGARKIIKDKINDKDHPEEILTDSRDGFDKEHPFYKKLVDVIWNWLWSIVSQQREVAAKSESILPPEVQRKWKGIFDIFNKEYDETVGDTFSGTITTLEKERPKGGIEFARSNIKITVGKKYGLQLRIDTNIIPKGSKIIITSENKKVSFTPPYIIIEEKDIDEENIVSKIITLTSSKANIADTIKATFKRRYDKVVVTVVKKEIFYPTSGLEFHPDYFWAIKDKRSKLNLYVDLSKIRIGGSIAIKSDNPRVSLEEPLILLKENDIISENIGKVNVFFIGKEVSDQPAEIKASIKSFEDTARVYIQEKKEIGRFKDWDFEKLPLPMQSLFDSISKSPRYGYILINKDHPLNKKYFGENPKKIDIESSPVAQLYLAELILNRCLDVMISDALKKGALKRRYPDNEHLDITNYIEEKKYTLGPIIHQQLINQDLFEGVKEISKKESKFFESIKLIPTVSEDDLNKLTDRERKIIEMRFSLSGGKPRTLEEIANQLGLTRERIRQILNNVLKKLGKSFTENDLDLNTKEKRAPFSLNEFTIQHISKKRKTMNSIINIVANYYGIKPDDIIGKRRKHKFVIPRMVAAFLMRDQLGISFPRIARKLGGRDHTTAIYSYEKISKEYSKDGKLKNDIENIKATFRV